MEAGQLIDRRSELRMTILDVERTTVQWAVKLIAKAHSILQFSLAIVCVDTSNTVEFALKSDNHDFIGLVIAVAHSELPGLLREGQH